MTNILRWLENLWNLRNIFDKYLPLIREHIAYIEQLKKEIEDLNNKINGK